MVHCYLWDLSQLGSFASVIESYADAFVEREHRADCLDRENRGTTGERHTARKLYHDAFRQLELAQQLEG